MTAADQRKDLLLAAQTICGWKMLRWFRRI